MVKWRAGRRSVKPAGAATDPVCRDRRNSEQRGGNGASNGRREMECRSVKRFQLLFVVIVAQIIGETHSKLVQTFASIQTILSSHASVNSTAFRIFGGKKNKSNKITCGPAQRLEYVITHVPVWKVKCKIVEDKVCEEPKKKGSMSNEPGFD